MGTEIPCLAEGKLLKEIGCIAPRDHPPPKTKAGRFFFPDSCRYRFFERNALLIQD
jgi:hypothetical protein